MASEPIITIRAGFTAFNFPSNDSLGNAATFVKNKTINGNKGPILLDFIGSVAEIKNKR